MSWFDLYLISRLDAIHHASVLFSSVFVALTIVMTGVYITEDAVKLKHVITTYIITFLCVMIAVFTPSTKDAIVIYTVPKIINSNFVQEDLPKEMGDMYKLVKRYMEKQINTPEEEEK